MVNKLKFHQLKAIGWSILGGMMLYATYLELESLKTTGVVSSKWKVLSLSGPGAVAMLIGYFLLSVFMFFLAFAEWRKDHKQ